jgi:hypothetical protein
MRPPRRIPRANDQERCSACLRCLSATTPGRSGRVVAGGERKHLPMDGETLMRDNGRAPIKASALAPNQIDLSGARPMAACPDCGWWSVLKGERAPMIRPHRTPDGRTYPGTDKRVRCDGSGQRLIVDIDAWQWQERLRLAGRQAAQHRAAQLQPRVARPSAPTPVFRIAAAR